MQQIVLGKEALLKNVASIVEKLMRERSIYQEKLAEDQVTQHIVSEFDKFSIAELQVITDRDLIDRIDGMMMLHAVAGMLNDFTSEEMQIFDEAVGAK